MDCQQQRSVTVCQSRPLLALQVLPALRPCLATLKVFNLYAKGLYGDRWDKTDGSVEVTYGDQNKRTAIISDNDNPSWPEIFEFGSITINMKNKLTFRVYDEDSYWNSDLLGQNLPFFCFYLVCLFETFHYCASRCLSSVFITVRACECSSRCPAI
uniref:C2 domain-containing protein n=1 Tax=Dicentrarchus labrax TaxID=13489 RepID=A0A8C4F9B0_DICLA